MTEFAPNLFDRALLAVAPERGLRRLRARMAADMALRAFDAAKFDRRLGGWIATGSSANAELYGANDRLRNRARDLERNNRVVASAAQQFAGQVVGTGVTVRPVHDSRLVRRRAADAWSRFCDTCDPEGQHDFAGVLNLTARTMFRDGEVLHSWLSVKGRPNAQIRVLEVDHLDNSPVMSVDGAYRDVMGVRFDRDGRRIGYHLFPTHPGDTGWVPVRGPSRIVPAEEVDHYYHMVRPGQARGVSWLAPSIVALRGNDDIEEAVRWRKRLEACIGLVLQSPESLGPAPVVGSQKAATSADGKGRIEEKMAPGMVLRFGPGEQAMAFTPAASDDTVEYLRQQLYAFCATTGIPYHAITGDVSQANYSSLRAATLAGNVVLDTVQWIAIAPRIKAAFRRVMQAEASAIGDDRLNSVRCELGMPIRPWVDPVKEITAKIFEIRAGLQSMPDALAERGLDWMQQLDELQAFMDALDERKIVIETDPRQTTRAGQLQQALVTGQPAGDSKQQ